MQQKLQIIAYSFIFSLCICYSYLAFHYTDNAVADPYYNTCITQEDYDLAVAERDNLKELLLTQSRLVSEFESSSMSKSDFISLFESP